MTKLTLSDVQNLQNESATITTLAQNNAATVASLENTVSRDGTLPNQMGADFDMNSHKILNLPDAVSDQEPATFSQLVERIASVDAGQIIDLAYVTVGNSGITSSERALTAGTNLNLTDTGPSGQVILGVSDAELNALAALTSAADTFPYFTGSGTAALTPLTSYARTLIDDTDATTARATLGSVIGTNVQAWDTDLDAVAGVSTAGLLARTGSGTASARTLQAPAAGFTITNPAGTAGDPTFVLANDLAAVEGLSGTGLIAHTAANTMTERTLTAPAAGITITNPAGIAGNPTLVLANDLAAYEGLAANGMVARTATDTAAVRTVTGTAAEITLTNGDGVAGNPTVSIPTAVTFTGKTITGGTYASPTFTTPALGTPASGVMTNVTGTASGLTAGNATLAATVTTNANLTGPITSTGNATAIASQTGTGTKFVVDTSPALTGTPTAPTAAAGTNTTQIATTAGIVAERAATKTLTNTTFDSAGTGNVMQVSGVTVSRGQYPGETTTGSATAGNIGEYVESILVTGSATALTTATAKNITSISLTAGDWDIDTVAYFNPAGTTAVQFLTVGLSLTTNTLDTTAGRFNQNGYSSLVTGGPNMCAVLPSYRFSLASTTTIFMVVQANFTVSTLNGWGIIRARRAR